MARKPKMKKGKPRKMAKGGVLEEGLVKPLQNSHAGAEKMIGGIRNAKNRMPERIKKLFPDI